MKKDAGNGSRLVWSSETGRMCPECGKAVKGCVCKKRGAAPAGDGVVRVRRESKGRGGKTVMVITGLPLDALALAALGAELKKACGSGGTVKDGTVEIQGDHGDRIMQELLKRGYQAKRAGG